MKERLFFTMVSSHYLCFGSYGFRMFSQTPLNQSRLPAFAPKGVALSGFVVTMNLHPVLRFTPN